MTLKPMLKLGYCSIQFYFLQRMYSVLIMSKKTSKHQEIMNYRKEGSSYVRDDNE